MTRVFKITEEQLESLVADALDTTAASIIKEEIMKNPPNVVNPVILPKTDSHDGDPITGLKRIYRWLNWEMVSWDNHYPEMITAFNAIGKAVMAYDTTADLDETNGW